MTGCRIPFVVGEGESGMRLSSFLRRRGVSLSVVRSLKYQEDGLAVNGARARTNSVLAAGDEVELRLQAETGFSARPQDIPLHFIYQSRDVVVVNKPAGMACHPGPSHHSGTLANALCGVYRQRGDGGVFRPVGRLDTDTSGLVLCAGNAASVHLLAQTAQKLYLALASGPLPEQNGCIDAPLAARPGSATAQQVTENGRPSVTEYHVLAQSCEASLVAVRPKTGRTHQIRAHFAHIGHPLLGDALYGGSRGLLARHGLHCAAARLQELSGNRPTLWCALPGDMQWALWRLGLHCDIQKALRFL